MQWVLGETKNREGGPEKSMERLRGGEGDKSLDNWLKNGVLEFHGEKG